MMTGIFRNKLLFLGLLLWWFINAGLVSAQEQVEAEPPLANPQVRLKTTKGEMLVELSPQNAPQTVDLFLQHAQAGRYNQLPFERYAEGFAIQLAAVKGAEPPAIADERKNGLKHVPGSVGLAWDYIRRQSGNKLYICLAPVSQLDNKHTLIGRVSQGLEVLLQLRPGDKLETITISEPSIPQKTEVSKKP